MQEILGIHLETDAKSDVRVLSAADQVVADLNAHLDRSVDRQKRLAMISKRTGLHLKTLQRLLKGENQPSYITVFRIYRYLFGESDDATVLAKCPPNVQSFLKKANPQSLMKSISYLPEVEQGVVENPVAIELLVLCSTGSISGHDIKDRFGSYGFELCQKLVQQDILAEIKPGIFSAGSKRINMSPEAVVKFGQLMVATYAKPENGYVQGLHFHGFYAEGLNAEAYQQWLRIDEEAYLKKVELAKKPESTGDIKTYTFISTDTLDKKVNR